MEEFCEHLRIENIQLTFEASLILQHKLSKGEILELSTKIKNTSVTLNNIADLMTVDAGKLRRDLSDIRKKQQSLRGIKKKEYLDEPYEYKSAASTKKETVTDAIQSTSREAENEVLQCAVKDSKVKIKEFETVNLTLEEENNQLKKDSKKLKRKIQSNEENIRKKRQKCSDLMRERRNILRRKDKGVELTKKQEEISALKKTINAMQKKQNESNNEKLKLGNELVSTLQSYQELEEENSMKDKQITDLKESLNYVELLVKDNNTVQTFDNDKKAYTTDTQFCIMNLLSEGVGVHHVSNVIKHVASLCGKTVSQLPSVTTVNRIGDQRASVAYQQISEELGKEMNTTLQSDETRKHGDSYEVFAVRDSSQKEWVIGLKDMLNKSSDSCLDTLKRIISDISSCTSTSVGNTILSQIKNTMSDRAATEKKFHVLLQEYREDILPACYSNWDSMSEAEKKSVTCMNNFFCGLHLLVNFADVTDKVIKSFEDKVKDKEMGAEAHQETKMFIKRDESSCIRLVRTTCKCLARGGDEKSGCYSEFKTFMAEKDEEENSKLKRSSLLVPFRGNRFNILFYNSEVVFYLSDEIKEFFKEVSIPSNRLQKAVNFDISENFHLAVLKALGLCSKVVTAPFWRVMEEKDSSLENTNNVYQKLLDFLERASEDSTDVMCGKDAPLPDLIIKDSIYERLIKSDELDSVTVAVLQQIFSAWQSLIRKAVGEHLKGGSFTKLTEELMEETKSVPRHNKFPERVFAMLDALTRFRPAATTLCNESYIMFSLNKTGEWLQTLPEGDKEKLLDMSRKEGKELRQKYIMRIREIENSKREVLKKKRAEIERKEHAKYEQREHLIDDMLYFGLWQSGEMVDKFLENYDTEAEKRKALNCQLRFRKIVLNQPGDKKLFQMSEKGKQHSIQTLTDNVKRLIKDSLNITRANPHHIFVGKRIKHYQMVEKVRTPFYGRVISTVPGFPQWCNVIYDNDTAIYAYKLIDDYNSGDLELEVEGREELGDDRIICCLLCLCFQLL